MQAKQLVSLLKEGALKKYKNLYTDINSQTERMIKAINDFCSIYGSNRDIEIFSVPGRSESQKRGLYRG